MKEINFNFITGKTTEREYTSEEESVVTKEKEAHKELEKKEGYKHHRKTEYPSIEELVVALYDADDKAEIDKKRAEIKKKYPKPE